MEYERAIEIIAENQHLIGKTIVGGKIDELIIYPTSENHYDNFFKSYMRTQNAQNAIIPYKNQDVEIYAIIEKGRMNTQGLLAHATLAKISTEHPVNL